MEISEPPKRRGRMNKLEAQFFEHLKGDPTVAWFSFEPLKFRLADGAWFTPDFAALSTMGQLKLIECKGFWREAARVRIKVAAEMFPFRFIAVTKDKKTGAWKYEPFNGRLTL